jgi:ABC-type branched-subunit amino acid transport system substrate-binding protein
LEEVLDSDVEAVICDADPVTAGEVAGVLRDGGWDGVLLGGPELAAADFTAVAGDAAHGALFVTPWPFAQDVQESGDFVTAYQAMGPHVEPPGPLALPAYEATWRLLEALEHDISANGAPTREGVTAALAKAESSDGVLSWYRIGGNGTPGRVP